MPEDNLGICVFKKYSFGLIASETYYNFTLSIFKFMVFHGNCINLQLTFQILL
jgi:hypothetical protein